MLGRHRNDHRGHNNQRGFSSRGKSESNRRQGRDYTSSHTRGEDSSYGTFGSNEQHLDQGRISYGSSSDMNQDNPYSNSSYQSGRDSRDYQGSLNYGSQRSYGNGERGRFPQAPQFQQDYQYPNQGQWQHQDFRGTQSTQENYDGDQGYQGGMQSGYENDQGFQSYPRYQNSRPSYTQDYWNEHGGEYQGSYQPSQRRMGSESMQGSMSNSRSGFTNERGAGSMGMGSSSTFDRGMSSSPQWGRDLSSQNNSQNYSQDYGSQGIGTFQGYQRGMQSGSAYGSQNGSGYNSQGRSYNSSQSGTEYGSQWSPNEDFQQGQGSFNSSRDTSSRGWESHSGKGPKGYKRSEERIKEDVSERLTHDSQIDATNIEVVLEGDTVVLRGTVDDRQAKRLAEDIAESVAGVRDVRNEIRVEGQTSSRTSATGTGSSSSRTSADGEETSQRGNSDRNTKSGKSSSDKLI